MSEKRIYHTYKIGNKVKNITCLTGLRRYSTVNKENVLTFSQLLQKNGFKFEHNLIGEISRHCRLCNSELPIFKIIEEEQRVLLSLCSCSVKTPLAINRGRFLSILTEEKVDEVYDKYCKNKMRKWTTADIPVASLAFKIKKYGKEDGTRRFKESNFKSSAPLRVEYYQRNGETLEEAEKKLKNRQSTFSLEKCINKFGKEEGEKVWKRRQEKWQATLNAKPIKEIERINQDKVWRSGNVSKISQQLFEQISVPGARWGNRRNNNSGEKLVIIDKFKCLVDFCVGNKIIEFFGDYWHANPTKNAPDKMFSGRKGLRTAKQIWENDANRISELRAAGYMVLIVWESDFKNHPEKVIAECKNFLNN